MKFIKNIFLIIFFFSVTYNSNSEIPYILNFKYILNESDAGKKAQNFLKSKLDNGLKKLKDKELKIQEEEKKIIQQKKILSAEEYKKKVTELRKKVSSLQVERNKLLSDVSKQRSIARNELLKSLNPILEKYMKDKKIRMVVDNKSILLADQSLNITQDVIKILNQKLKTIKLK